MTCINERTFLNKTAKFIHPFYSDLRLTSITYCFYTVSSHLTILSVLVNTNPTTQNWSSTIPFLWPKYILYTRIESKLLHDICLLLEPEIYRSCGKQVGLECKISSLSILQHVQYFFVVRLANSDSSGISLSSCSKMCVKTRSWIRDEFQNELLPGSK